MSAILLDTNVIIYWAHESCPMHEEAKQLIRKAMTVNMVHMSLHSDEPDYEDGHYSRRRRNTASGCHRFL